MIILGAGRRGTLLAQRLIQEKQDVIVIEMDPKRASEIQNKLDCMVVVGSGTDYTLLKRIEVEKADFFIAVTDSDEINLVACGLVEYMANHVHTIVAIRNLTYTGKEGLPPSVLGINHIVNPEAETAKSIFTTVERGLVHDVVTFLESNVVAYDIEITPTSKFANKTVAEVRSSLGYEFVIAAMLRREHSIVAEGNIRILPGDRIIVVVPYKNRDMVKAWGGDYQTKPKRIVIVGGSTIARFFIRSFESSRHHAITLIDHNQGTCETFASLFPQLLVINSDITDETIFDDEQLNSADLFITLTDNDELNIVIASYAKSIGVQKTIALIKQNNNYIRLAKKLGIDLVISVTHATVDSLLKFLRGSSVSSVHSFFDGLFEIIEVVLEDKMNINGKKIEQLGMRGKGVIAAITTADGEVIIPSGSYQLKTGDVLFICAERQSLQYIQKLLS